MNQLLPAQQEVLNFCSTRCFGYTVLEYCSTFLKVVAVVTAIFMLAYGFKHFHIKLPIPDLFIGSVAIPIGTLLPQIGILLGIMGFYYATNTSAHLAAKRKHHYQTYGESYLFEATGIEPKNETSTFQKIVNRISNTFSGIFRVIAQSMDSCRTEYPSANCGKWRDIWQNDQTITDPNMAKIAKKYGIISTSTIETDPYGGICLGSCFIFAKHYLTNGEYWEPVAKEFAGGAPFEAVVLQGQYRHMIHSVHRDWSARVSERVRDDAATAEIAGLKLTEERVDLKKEAAITALMNQPEGVYTLSHTLEEGLHAVLLIKKEKECIFFDPNRVTYSFGIEKLKSTLESELSSKKTVDFWQLTLSDTSKPAS